MNSAFMLDALAEARIALVMGEVPIGAVIEKGGVIIARAHNLCEHDNDPTAHAEMLCIRRAALVVNDWRLTDCTLYVTLEPCAMCAGAIVNARLDRVYFGAYDPVGCCGSLYRLTEDPAFNHFCSAIGGVSSEECQRMLNTFFLNKRRHNT